MDLFDKVKDFPHAPGIYKFYSKGKVVYVGKSKDLRTRVASYFRAEHERQKLYVMMEFVDDVEIEICDSHLEARLLEYRYIREIQPMYNAQFKMEKTSFYLKLDPNKMLDYSVEDGLGPFLGQRILREFIKLMSNCYPIEKSKSIYIFDYNILAKRLGKLEKQMTFNALNSIFYEEKQLEVFESLLKEKMLVAAKSMNFELAAKYKELLDYFSYIKELIINKSEFLVKNWIFKEDGCLLLIHNGELVYKERSNELEAFSKKSIELLKNFTSNNYNYEMKSICYSEYKDPKVEVYEIKS